MSLKTVFIWYQIKNTLLQNGFPLQTLIDIKDIRNLASAYTILYFKFMPGELTLNFVKKKNLTEISLIYKK